MTLRDHLRSIYDANDGLTPAMVVDVARPEDHPLHHRFEWDDALAGEAYRRVQAAQLIRSVKVRYREGDEMEAADVRAFVAVRRTDAPETATYMPVGEAFMDPFTRQLVLRDAEREWKQLQRRYGHLAEFAQMVLADVAAVAS